MIDRWDILTLAGLALVAAGCWLLAPWLALVVAGLALASLGLLGAKNEKAGT